MSIAVVYGQTCFAPRYAMQESAHNMGAVPNSNDYFDTAPASGSYLATHWNLGWSGNLFLSFP